MRYANHSLRAYRVQTADGLVTIPAATVNLDGTVTPGEAVVADPDIVKLLKNVKHIQGRPRPELRLKSLEDEVTRIKSS